MTKPDHTELIHRLDRQLHPETLSIRRAFSYTLSSEHTPQVLALTLQQQETGCTLSVTMHRDTDGLRVYQFHLIEDRVLAEICASLYDAALIDLVLQTLDLLFYCASYWNQAQMTWVLPAEDAEHMTYFDHFFNTFSHETTALQARIPVSAQDYREFCERAEEVRCQLYQTLWQLQKTDRFLRRYLQDPSIRHNLKAQNTHSTSRISSFDGQVLAFPQSAPREHVR